MWMRYVLSDCLFAQSFYDIGAPIWLLTRVDSGQSGALSDDLFVKSVYDIDCTYKASDPYG